MAPIIVDIYTDGACSGNPGPGGWGIVIICNDRKKEIYGGEKETTNNRMEMTAAIKALEALSHPSHVRLYTDSIYLRNGITQWIERWKKNGWKTADNKKVKNVDLWRHLESAAGRHEIKWQWIKGHSGHPENDRADKLARTGIQEMS